jgi:hypothetical protein
LGPVTGREDSGGKEAAAVMEVAAEVAAAITLASRAAITIRGQRMAREEMGNKDNEGCEELRVSHCRPWSLEEFQRAAKH